MLSEVVWQRIRHLAALGWSDRRIAQELGLSRNTVRKARAEATPPRYQRAPAPSPLEPWRTLLEGAVRRGLRGTRVLEELRAAGYAGARSTFYTHWTAFQAAQRQPAYCRFETGPGEQAQFDWAEYVLSLGGIATKVFVFSLLLGYSRRVHWFPSLAQNQEAVFEGLEAGLRHFGGSCRFLVVDNPKVFLHAHRGAEIRWNAAFLRFCGHYRLEPIACTPRHPQGKGKVENPFGHLEQGFLKGSAWPDWERFQQALAAYEARWEQRVHGTTGVPPSERFATEQPQLLPLPEAPFLGWEASFREVSKDCLLSFQGVRYSVPWAYAGKQVRVRVRQGRELVVYAPDGQCLARHGLRPRGSPPVMLAAHYEGLRRRHQAAFAGLARQFRERYGEHGSAEAFLQRLLAQHQHRPEQALGQVLELLGAAPDSLALGVLAEAVEFNLCTPRFLTELLRRRLACPGAEVLSADRLPPPLGTQLVLPELAIERPLCVYGRALDPAGKEPA